MPEQETTKVYCGTCGSEIPFGIDIGHECKPEQETRMTPKVEREQLRKIVYDYDAQHAHLRGYYSRTDLLAVAKLVAQAHPPAGESCGKRFVGASGRSIFTCVLPKDHAGDCDDCPNRANLTIGESGDTFKCAKCKKLQPQADRCECGGSLYNVTPEAGESALDIGKPSDGMIFWRDKFCAEENHHPAEIGKVSLDFAEWFASKCGESAHEDGWVSRATKSAPIMQDCMVVVRRYSEGIFLDQWQQVAWRRPDGRWIDDEDLVESSDRYDNRVIEFWHKLKALPCAPEKEKR